FYRNQTIVLIHLNVLLQYVLTCPLFAFYHTSLHNLSISKIATIFYLLVLLKQFLSYAQEIHSKKSLNFYLFFSFTLTFIFFFYFFYLFYILIFYSYYLFIFYHLLL